MAQCVMRLLDCGSAQRAVDIGMSLIVSVALIHLPGFRPDGGAGRVCGLCCAAHRSQTSAVIVDVFAANHAVNVR